MATKRVFIRCLRRLYQRFLEDEVLALAAQLAYNFILSFFPFLIFLMTLVGFSPLSSDRVLGVLDEVFPKEVFILVRNTVREVLDNRNGGWLSFSIIVILVAASNGVGAVIHGLNKAYDRNEDRPWLKVKAIALLFTVALTLVIIFSLILLVFGGVLERELIKRFGLPDFFSIMWNLLRHLLILFIMMLTFISLYLYTPNQRLRCREVIPGAVFSTLGWVAISMGFAYYVDNFGYYSMVYGSITGVIILLIWLYISAVIILLGGELNATLALDLNCGKKSLGREHRTGS